MESMFQWLVGMVPPEQLIAWALAIFAPQLTDLVKKLVPHIPPQWKPVVNGIIGAISTGLLVDPTMAAGGVAVAHMMGKKREVKKAKKGG